MLRSIRITAAAVVLLVAGAAMAAQNSMVKDTATQSAQAEVRKQLEQRQDLQASIRTIVLDSLVPLTAHAEWVKAVVEQNAQDVPMTTVMEIHRSWDSTEDELPTQRALMTNPCGKAAFKLTQQLRTVRQVTVMDNRGVSVCQSTLNKPYWNGESGAWKQAFAEGKGGVLIEPVQYDGTANAKLQQVSLPIFGDRGKVIGAVTFGIAVG